MVLYSKYRHIKKGVVGERWRRKPTDYERERVCEGVSESVRVCVRV